MTLLPGEKLVLVLQGGGALGAYQAGAYEALAEAGLEPEWVAGISIGAVNGAIIAGNRPEDRVDKLREFWEGVSDGVETTLLAAPSDASRPQRIQCRTRPDFRRSRLLQPARSAGLFSSPAGKPGRHQRLHHGPVAPDASLISSISRCAQWWQSPLQRWRRRDHHGELRLFRQRRHHIVSRSHHGQQRAAARAFRLSSSTARPIGTAASSPTRPCNTCSK